jgi:dATP pyrophosphohydrolase
MEAACRELAEETGLGDEGPLLDMDRSRMFTIDPRWRDRYAPGITENTEHEWRYRLTGAVDIEINDDEHKEFRWVPIDRAVDTVWSWTNKEALVALRAELLRDLQQV